MKFFVSFFVFVFFAVWDRFLNFVLLPLEMYLYKSTYFDFVTKLLQIFLFPSSLFFAFFSAFVLFFFMLFLSRNSSQTFTSLVTRGESCTGHELLARRAGLPRVY